VILIDWFLVALTKLRKAAIYFVMSVRPSLSAAWNDLAQTGRIFMKFDIWIVFEKKKLSKKFKCPRNWKRITGTLREDQYTFSIYLAQFFLEW